VSPLVVSFDCAVVLDRPVLGDDVETLFLVHDNGITLISRVPHVSDFTSRCPRFWVSHRRCNEDRLTVFIQLLLDNEGIGAKRTTRVFLGLSWTIMQGLSLTLVNETLRRFTSRIEPGRKPKR